MKLLKVIEGKVIEFGEWVTYSKDLRLELIDHTVEKNLGFFKTTITPSKNPYYLVNVYNQSNLVLASWRVTPDMWIYINKRAKSERVELGVHEIASLGELHFFLENGTCSAYKKSSVTPHVLVEIHDKKGYYWQWKFSPSDWENKNKYSIYPITIGSALTPTGETNYFYMFKGVFYVSEISMSDIDVRAVIENEQKAKQEKLSKELDRIKAHTDTHRKTRTSIPESVQVFVWNRDKGKCVKCGSSINLEFDHIVPLSKGGSNTARNIQLLCEKCNRSKGANIG